MGFLILLAVFFILAVLYIVYTSYFSQILINIKKKKLKKVILQLLIEL